MAGEAKITLCFNILNCAKVKKELREDFKMDEFGVYAIFGVNGPPQRLLR